MRQAEQAGEPGYDHPDMERFTMSMTVSPCARNALDHGRVGEPSFNSFSGDDCRCAATRA